MNRTPLSYKTKEELIAALEARRPALVEIDRRSLSKHKKAEKEALANFRQRCREAAKASYEDAKSKYRYGSDMRFNPPTCPTSMASRLNSVIAALNSSGQRSFQINHDGKWHQVHWLLTYDPSAEVEMC